MSTENSVSIEIPQEVLKSVREALIKVKKDLEPYVLALTPVQRKKIPKMSDGTEPFVAKVIEYCKSNPEFCPPFLDVKEMDKDFIAVSELLPLLRSIEAIQSNVNDTAMLAGSECYVTALGYYNSVKLGAKMNYPDAKTIYESLRKRFDGNGKEKPKND